MKLAGSHLGPYEIHSSIGAGGMGEVYRAKDTRLDRIVALKVIAGAAALDDTFRERFDREARAISALDHPHICALYDVGHENGIDFLVMQFLEGETLADRLARGARPKSDASSGSQTVAGSAISKGPIPIDQALRYGTEIASALDAAHRRGVVHRDLKPGNIILTKSGSKLLDFGLAKLTDPAVAGMGEFPTKTVPLTSSGSIVGTLNYMSPEQLEGGTIDARSDVFAFGAVLFEMLSGRRAFNAQSHAGLIAAILNDEPPELDQIADVRSPLSPSAHRALDRLLRKCLAKDPDDRWQCAADLAAELRWIDEERLRLAGQPETPSGTQPPLAGSRTRERWWMAAAAAGILATAALGGWALTRRPPEPRTVSFDLMAPEGRPFRTGPGLLSVSPDGKHVAAVVGATPETSQLTVRSLDSPEFRLLSGTEGAWQPFWSPDSRSIGFNDRAQGTGNLKRVDLAGGAILTLATESRSRATWGSAGLILMGGGPAGLSTVPDTGGSPTLVAKPDQAAGESGYAWPLFLPDGRRFLYLALHSDRQKNAIFLGSLDSASRTRVVAADSSFELSAGHLLFQRNGTLYAQTFDAGAGRVTGDARPMLEGVVFNSVNGRMAVSASSGADALVYRSGRAIIGRQNTLTWLDMTGKPLGTLGGPEGMIRHQILSPDGTRVALARGRPGEDSDIYVLDSQRNLLTRLTSDSADDLFPIWSPNGAHIYFSSTRNGTPGIYRRSAGGAGSDELVFESPAPKFPSSLSMDGKLLLITMLGEQSDIWAVPLEGNGKPQPIRQTTFNEGNPVLSPDGRWLAYTADDIGTRQIYVEPFPATGPRERISTTEVASTALWSADGRTIFYLTSEGTVAAVDVTVAGAVIRAGAERALFETANVDSHSRALSFDPAESRFLAITSTSAGVEATPLTVLLNWTSTLRASSATGR